MATLSLTPFPPLTSPSSFPVTSSRKPISQSISYSQLVKPNSPYPISIIKPITTFRKFIIVKATKEDDPPLQDVSAAAAATATSESESQSSPNESTEVELTELGAEIKKAMEEKQKIEGGEKDFWSGVAEEIGEIEWPGFGRVLRTTGVVMGVIAGSSVVLLTVNAVLAELSDKVFAGRGVQDFFG